MVTGTAAGTVAEGWLLREPRPASESGTLLFCFPYLGTGASMFYSWPRMIGPVEVCPIQPPGRENRLAEPSYESYPSLAAAMIEALRPYLDRRYALFSHCNTVYALYEFVEQLEAAGLPLPVRFVASAMVPPSLLPFGTILDLPDTELAEVVAGFMRARGAEADPELVELALEPVAADLRAYRDYRPSLGKLSCAVTSIAWNADTNVRPELAEKWAEIPEARLHRLNGDHWAFLRCPPELRAVLLEDCGEEG